jgi:hypothetical protein
VQAVWLNVGGEGEIRTPEPREGLPVFKTGAINRSATSPNRAGDATRFQGGQPALFP